VAGDWIKMRLDLGDDPAVIGLGSSVGLDTYQVVGRLHKLWSWADRQSRDGHAVGVTEKWIDRYVECDGFAKALCSVGWLSAENGSISFPNFDRHNGKTAKSRALAASRQRNARVSELSRAKRDKSVTREEKRRSTPIVPLPGFDAFWKAWPDNERKQAKGECSLKWRKGGFEQCAAAILAHVESLKASDQWRQGFVPGPSVYLNQRRWEGAPLSVAPASSKLALGA
jgi:hypothetical protein